MVAHDCTLYGATRSLLDLIDGLRPHGVEPMVVYPVDGELTAALEERGVERLIVPFANWMSRAEVRLRARIPLRLARNAALLPFLAGKVARWGADAVYTNSSVTPAGAYVASVLGKPHLWHIREFGWLDHGLRHDLGEAYFRFWLNRAAAVLAVSGAVEGEVLAGIKAQRHILHDSVASAGRMDSLRPEAVSRPPGPHFVFAILGHIMPSKGQESAIRAMAHLRGDHPEARLLMAGTGTASYVGGLRKLSRDLGVEDRVDFLGWVSDPFEVFARCDAGLMCSRCEALGRVTAEAMAAARPVVGYDSGGTPELVEDGVTGLLYRGGAEELAAAMARLADDPEWSRELGLAAWERARREYTTEAYAARVLEVFRDTLAR